MTHAARPLQHGPHLRDVDSDCVSNAMVRKSTSVARPVDGRWTPSQDFRDLAHGQELAHQPRNLVVRREAVQQGSSEILAQAWA